MARRTSILTFALLLQLLLPLVSPLFALGGDDDASLPACCRRNGAHHCAMRMQRQALPANGAPQVDTPYHGCPFLPHAVPAGVHSMQLFSPMDSAALLPPATHPASAPQAESQRRIAAERARYKRGPPSLLRLA